jgi:hypothetical protein
MISKRIDRKKKTSSFERLGKYVLEAKTQDAAILWTPTAEYVVDLNGEGEKVLWSRLTNCDASIPVLAIAEIEATQAQNTRSQADKTYHMVISFPEGEHPSRGQLEDIEDEMCKALGFEEHQRISAVHKDTDNIHLHVAINKIHPKTHNLLEPYRDYYIRDKQCRVLEKKHGLEVDNGIKQGQHKGKAAEMEAHTGEESLLSWIKAELGESIKQVKNNARSWQDLHSVLAEHDLVIKPRGAGLVIGTKDEKVHVKASSVDRGLSMKALTEQFGEYVPPHVQTQAQQQPEKKNSNQQEKPHVQTYERRPRDKSSEIDSLWGQYQKDKNSAYQSRTAALNGIRSHQSQDRKKVLEFYRKKRGMVKGNPLLKAPAKRVLYSQLSGRMKAELEQHKKGYAERRREIVAKNPAVTWDNWLSKQAEQGNVEALTVLRNRKQTRLRLARELLTAESLEHAKTIIHPHLKPIVRQNGGVHYRLSDGGAVEDSKEAVHVPQVTEAATVLALSLAQERFPGKALKVEGSTEFKVKVAEMSVLKGLDITFSDRIMEQTRQRYALMRDAKAHENGGRNAVRQKGREEDNHRGYTR